MANESIAWGSRDEQIHRIGRVLEIIQQIAIAPGYWNRKSLAAFHEVGERMIQKDLEQIKVRLGLKLRRVDGGYCFESLPHLPTQTYSFSEALALMMAARTAQAAPGINSAELSAAIARLEAIFPEELRPVLREAAQLLPHQAVKERRQQMLTLLHRAWVERRQLAIIYHSASGSTGNAERIVEPYHILPYGRSWHLVAYDHLRQAVIIFKVDRVQSAALLDTRYTIPSGFDIDDYLGDGWGLMRGATRPVEEVRLIFSPPAAAWVAEEQWHKSQRVEELEDGRVRVIFTVGVTPEMVNWLLYYGEHVQVEHPDDLREQVRERHRKAAQRNDMEGTC